MCLRLERLALLRSVCVLGALCMLPLSGFKVDQALELTTLSLAAQPLAATPPSVPQNLVVIALEPHSVSLEWDYNADATTVGYKIWRDGAFYKRISDDTFIDIDAAPDASYTYAVSAFDDASPPNESPVSTAVTVVTPSVAPGAPPDDWPATGDDTLPLGGVFYGTAVSGRNTGNASIGYDNAIRFRAQRSGDLVGFGYNNRTLTAANISDRCTQKGSKKCLCVDNGLDEFSCGYILGNSYHVGNGGLILVEVREDDDTSEHRPSSKVLGHIATPFVPTDYAAQNHLRLQFKNPISVQAGRLYHLTFRNLNPPTLCALSGNSISDALNVCERDAGAISLNGIWHGEFAPSVGGVNAGKWGPFFAEHSATALRRSSVGGAWKEDANNKPFYELQYADGVWAGMFYTGNSRQMSTGFRNIEGDTLGRQRFTVQRKSRQVDGVWVSSGHALERYVSGASMKTELKDDSGNILAVGSIPFSPQCAQSAANPTSAARRSCKSWGYTPFATPVMLNEGSSYSLELSAPAGAGFTIYSYNLKGEHAQDVNVWTNSRAEASTDRGVSWETWDKRNGRADELDLPVLFTLVGMPRALPLTTSAAGNTVPSLSALPPLSLQEGVATSIPVASFDADSDNLSLSLSSAPAFASLTDNGDGTGSIAVAPINGDAGSYDITLRVTDDGVPIKLAERTFTLTVTANSTHTMPVLAPLEDQRLDVGARVSLPLSSTDADGNALSLSLVSAPSFVAIADNGDGTGRLDIEPFVGDVGAYEVTVRTTDDGVPSQFAEQTFTLNVIAPHVNVAPVLTAIEDQLLQEGATASLPLSSTDADGDALALSLVSAPPFVSIIDNGDGTGGIDITPQDGDADNYAVTLRATDDGVPSLFAESTFTLNVTARAVNSKPVLSAVADQRLEVATTASVALSSVDADGDTLTLNLSNTPAFVTFTDNGDGTGRIDMAPVDGDEGHYEITVLVHDDGVPLRSDSQAFTILVSSAPTAEHMPRTTQGLLLLYTFDASAGSRVFDKSKVLPRIDLEIDDAKAVTWLEFGALQIDAATVISSQGAAQKLNTRLPASGAVTLEMWVASTRTFGTERIVSISQSNSRRNITLDQGGGGSDPGSRYEARLRTSATGNAGSDTFLRTNKGVVTPGVLQHVVYTRDVAGRARLYVDGGLQKSGNVTGHLGNWDASYALLLANETNVSRPWLGRYDLLAVYERALTQADVLQNYAAGPDGANEFDETENAPPVAVADEFVTDEDTAILGNLLADNGHGADSDVDGGALTVTQVDGSASNIGNAISTASGATLTVTANGEFSYDPRPGVSLQALAMDEVVVEGFTYTLSDASGASSSAIVNVTITGLDESTPNSHPVAQPDLFTIDESSVLYGDVLADNGNGIDVDPENTPLSVQTVDDERLPSGARLTLNGDGKFAYDPSNAFDSLNDGDVAFDTFSYTVEDGNLGVDSATVSITVTGVSLTNGNTPPTVTITFPAHGAVFAEGESVTLSANATDNEDGNLSDDIVWSDASGVLGTGGLLVLAPVLQGVFAVTASVDDNGTPSRSDSDAVSFSVEPPIPPDVTRVTDGLLALYTFDEGHGDTVFDQSGFAPPLDLLIDDTSAVNWGLDGTLEITSPTIVRSNGAATKLNTLIPPAGSVTLEAWLQPSRTVGTERIVTLSENGSRRNLSIDQGGGGSAAGTRYDARLRTSATGANGSSPFTRTAKHAVQVGVMQHVLYVYDVDGTSRIYVDGVLNEELTIGGKLLGAWQLDHVFALANEVTGGRPWLGRFDLVAIYERALSEAEITRNFNAGPQ